MRFFVALVLGKASEKLLRRLSGRGSNTPGEIMLRVCPDILERFKMPPLTVCITGTNGKTSTSNLVTEILRAAGKKVVNNSKGSNMAPGLVTALAANCDMKGVVKADAAVLETDERSSQYIYPHFAPDYILCTNLFRDSIKRNGHSEFIFDKINDFLPEKTTLILNGNDMISGMLGEGKCKRIFYATDRTAQSTGSCPNLVCDITACPKCLHKLDFEWYHYHHLGKVKCSHCGFSLPQAKYLARDVDFENGTFTLFTENTSTPLPFAAQSLFNVFNATAAAALCIEAGVSPETVGACIKDVSSKTGRFVTEKSGTLSVVSMLSKNQNPVSCSQSLSYIKRINGTTDVVLTITDPESKHGHEDISWLYDVDFKPLLDEKVRKVYVGGERCFDVALRLITEGVPEEKIVLFKDYEKLAAALPGLATENSTVIIYFSLYSMKIAGKIKTALLSRGKDGENR